MTPAKFEQLATTQKSKVSEAVRALQTAKLDSIDEVEAALATFDFADQWYQGGMKEMRTEIEGWVKTEARIEAMQECVMITKAVLAAASAPVPRLVILLVHMMRPPGCFDFRP